ncbi:hypothetical protein [Deinococcus altitudinis]|uniref:hypothetical protein n=1 Tax=Deinococcus altitudinis TaxID=468914 RepID=UPI0038916DFE
MKRRQLIRICLMTSLRKRFWMVVLSAVLLGSVAFVLTFSLHIVHGTGNQLNLVEAAVGVNALLSVVSFANVVGGFDFL